MKNCVVQKLMPDFALRSGGNEGSSKMYQVAPDAPQRRSVTFDPVLYLLLLLLMI